MPVVPVVLVVLGALGIGGVAYCADQHHQRERDRTKFRKRLKRLARALSEKEAELAALCARLGEKNGQVRILADEVVLLRREIKQIRKAA